ncbi:MAG: transposase-like protein [Verrucomicrobiales bacterium]|jgi:transposase-like protein
MPWKNVSPMEQKQQFVSLAGSGRFTVTELYLEFGISRKTGHKWLRRHGQDGMAGLEDRSRDARKGIRTEWHVVNGTLPSASRLDLSGSGWHPASVDVVAVERTPPFVRIERSDDPQASACAIAATFHQFEPSPARRLPSQSASFEVIVFCWLLLAWIAGGEILAPSCGAVISQNERGVRSTLWHQQSLVPFESFCGAMRFSARVRLIYMPFRPDP